MKKPRFTEDQVLQALLKYESVVPTGVLYQEMGITPANFNKLKSECLMRTLEGLTLQRGKPQLLRTDNDTEFTTKEFGLWCKEHEIEFQSNQPDRPIQKLNCKIKPSLPRSYFRCLNLTVIREIRALTKEWTKEYNPRRLYEGLQNQTLYESKQQILSLT